LQINNKENGYLSLYTNDTERIKITSNGNVSIGTTNDTYKLNIVGD
jgi:hypothetical protein